MKREHSHQNKVLAFISGYVQAKGEFPTNAEITRATRTPPWRVASRLTALVNAGRLTRTQLRERGTPHEPKYAYSIQRDREEDNAR